MKNSHRAVSSDTWFLDVAICREFEGLWPRLAVCVDNAGRLINAELLEDPADLAHFLDVTIYKYGRTTAPSLIVVDRGLRRYLTSYEAAGLLAAGASFPIGAGKAERWLRSLTHALSSRMPHHLTEARDIIVSIVNDCNTPTSPRAGCTPIPQAGVSTPDPAGGPS